MDIEEQLDLIERAQRGENKAAERIIEQFAPLCRKLAGKYLKACRKTGHEMEDLEQVAKIALWRAILKFDPSRGVRPITLFHKYIDWALNDVRKGASHQPETVNFDGEEDLDLYFIAGNMCAGVEGEVCNLR